MLSNSKVRSKKVENKAETIEVSDYVHDPKIIRLMLDSVEQVRVHSVYVHILCLYIYTDM